MKTISLGRQQTFSVVVALVMLTGTPTLSLAGGDIPSEFSQRGSIANTRHNLTQRNAETLGGASINAGFMDAYRNDYGEVCVYCHTPHGANNGGEMSTAPLWNRNVNPSAAYTTYASNNSTTITEAISGPGPNSLTCLSCHDGTIAIDSIMNMPGSGRYSANPDTNFLDGWTTDLVEHRVLGTELGAGNNTVTCMQCHQPQVNGGTLAAADFSVYVIGQNLTNDHPIGITYPASRVGVDFNGTNATTGNNAAIFYDEGTVGFMNASDVRFYQNSGGDYTVECASCHDPHGVDSAGPGSNHLPTFLRKTNAASALCQTCHNK